MSQYSLPAHVHHCLTEDGLVLLDLKKRRYFGLPRSQLHLVRDSAPEQPTLAPPRRSATESTVLSPDKVFRADICNFLAAVASAALALKLSSLERIVAAAGRKKQLSSSRAQGREGDIELLARRYRLMRPFLYTYRDSCLLDSLALLRFLARYHHYPQWVIGVRTQPFRAHSWLQCGDVVLNDTAEHASSYKPLLVV
jgi:hypothetical protein